MTKELKKKMITNKQKKIDLIYTNTVLKKSDEIFCANFSSRLQIVRELSCQSHLNPFHVKASFVRKSYSHYTCTICWALLKCIPLERY